MGKTAPLPQRDRMMVPHFIEQGDYKNGTSNHWPRSSKARVSRSRFRQCRQYAAEQEIVPKDVLPFFGVLSPCVVGIEACSSGHYWAREIRKLGHDVRLIPPSYVKLYVRRGAKNDAADAVAICEAVSRHGMRFVAIKSEQDQAFLMLHRVRGLLVRQRTMVACVSGGVRSDHPARAAPYR